MQECLEQSERREGDPSKNDEILPRRPMERHHQGISSWLLGGNDRAHLYGTAQPDPYEQQYHGKYLGIHRRTLCQAGYGASMLCKGQQFPTTERYDERHDAVQLAEHLYAGRAEPRYQGLSDRRSDVRKRVLGRQRP